MELVGVVTLKFDERRAVDWVTREDDTYLERAKGVVVV